MKYFKDLLCPPVRSALACGLKSYAFWALLGIGFGLSYCNSKAAFGDGFTPYAFMSWALFSVLALIAVVDVKKLIVPDVLVFPLLIAGLLLAAPLSQAIWGAGLLGGGFWLVRLLSSKFLKQEAMGLGDVKLAAALGVWVGAWGVVPLILVASFSALVVLVIRKFLRHNQTHTPFAPYLALGAWVTFAYGNTILKFLFTLRQNIVGLL